MSNVSVSYMFSMYMCSMSYMSSLAPRDISEFTNENAHTLIRLYGHIENASI